MQHNQTEEFKKNSMREFPLSEYKLKYHVERWTSRLNSEMTLPKGKSLITLCLPNDAHQAVVIFENLSLQKELSQGSFYLVEQDRKLTFASLPKEIERSLKFVFQCYWLKDTTDLISMGSEFKKLLLKFMPRLKLP